MKCSDLIHPFQNDPGCSQNQRIMSELLSGPAKIDSRTLADLLDYFVKLSVHINFYEVDGTIKDWSPFFENSPPFIISAITRFNKKNIEETIAFYDELFNRKPTKTGLRLLIGYINSRILEKVNSWQQKLKKDIELPLNLVMNKLIKDKLSPQLKEFISLSNTAVKWYGIRSLNYNLYQQNEAWDLDTADLHSIISTQEFKSWGSTKRKRLLALRKKIAQLVPTFLDVINILSITAGQSLEQSMFPLAEELKEKHPPHLAIIFSFLKLFSYLQGDLNLYTRKHLDFFYKNVLKLKAHDSVPDKAHIVFEIQKQLDKYLLKKGLLLKDGKDNNKVDILFSTDDEIVVNKTQVADKRTLFLNNQLTDTVCVEGVYMAPDAAKADGVEKDFTDDAVSSWPTLGAHYSKYTDPENKFIKPYPNARIGLVLASPVLLLNEGKRTIDITLSCEFKDICNSLLPVISNSDPCCEDSTSGNSGGNASTASGGYPEVLDPKELYEKVRTILNQSWYYINRGLIADAVKLGISKDLLDKLNGFLIKTPPEKLCYCPVDVKLYERILTDAEFNITAAERIILKDIFKPRKALNIAFSGEKEWIVPVDPPAIDLQPSPLAGNSFTITIHSVIQPEQKAITFYNAENLKEDLGTTMPLVKIELDDKIKLSRDIPPGAEKEECCERAFEDTTQPVSLYHFFRDVVVMNNNNTKIDVKVCGLKNLIVQNDENVEDVNKLIHPFGVRPKVGANFYIGSGELFMKKWKEIWVNAEWKDRPFDFNAYYTHYSYVNDPFEDGTTVINNNSFKINIALLENGIWKPDGASDLFTDPKTPWAQSCGHAGVLPQWFEDVYDIQTGSFASAYIPPQFSTESLTPYNLSSRYGFLRFTLDGVSFQHERYAFVLARHMMALADLVDPISIKMAQDLVKNAKKVIDAIVLRIQEIVAALEDIEDDIIDAGTGLLDMLNDLGGTLIDIGDKIFNADYVGAAAAVVNAITKNNDVLLVVTDILIIRNNIDNNLINSVPLILDFNNLAGVGIKFLSDTLKNIIDQLFDLLKVNDDLKIGLPKEPYTPTLKSISIDYTATAPITDINLIHLYPYTGTYKNEELESQPALLPTYCDEGNLFLGLTGLVPGSSLNILFQLAEATADSESERDFIKWYYLENNIWKLLRSGFEVLDDATDGLTTSGIVKFALPANMTNENTVMPKGMHWLKAAIPSNSKSVSETIGIHTQAIRAEFTNDTANDKLRLSEPLAAGKLSKLLVADASVKKTLQPYDSFGGRLPEGEGHFYVRISELLRHKGRAIQKFDYERMVLEAFPQLFKAKCINHSFALNAHRFYNDFPVAPGYVLLAVIPDLNKLKAAKQFEPRVPVSLLEDIQEYFRGRTSPFVRLWVKNPRYEKVNFCLKVKVYLGKDESYYREKLKQDLREFLAPWAVGEYDKLTFGQCIVRSDIVQFIESRDYVDYILDLKMQHENDTLSPVDQPKVCPVTPRSILIAGIIDVCIKQQECESWCEEGIPCENEPEPVADYCKEEEIIG